MHSLLPLAVLLLLRGSWSQRPGAFRWKHSSWLAEEQTSPRVYWAAEQQHIYVQVEANTIGSIRLEIDSYDVVVLWVDDVTGEPFIQDYHISNSSTKLDYQANYHLVGGNQNSTHTTVAFRRKWNTCDEQDAFLGGDTVRISWSIHAHDPGDEGGEVPEGEAVHGEKSLLLRGPVLPPKPQEGAHVQSWDVLMHNVLVPENMPTQYWCKIFQSPPMTRKSQIIGYEPLILSQSANLIHHLLLYECSATPGYLDTYAVKNHAGAPCYSPDMPTDWETCVTPIATWVVGGGAKIFPEHIGIPVGPRQMYYMLEVHYDNPGLRRAIDNSGFRLHLTEDIRPFDAGVIQTGVMVTPLHIVPPQQPRYLSSGLCNDICTNRMFPEKGIKVVSVLLHSHLAGRAMRLRHIRGDREVPLIVEDNRYDFAFQQDRTLNEEVTVFPGDQLVTECEYDTRDRQTTTFGGYSTREEMCLSFITYYPRTKLSSCQSMSPVKHFFRALGIKAFYGRTIEEVEKYILRTAPMSKLNSTERSTVPPVFESDAAAILQLQKMADFVEEVGEQDALLQLVISEPAEFRDRNLARHLQALPWNEDVFTHSFEKSLARGLQMIFCRQKDDTLAVPLNIESFPNFTLLPKTETQDCIEANVLAQSNGVAAAVVNSFVIFFGAVFLKWLC